MSDFEPSDEQVEAGARALARAEGVERVFDAERDQSALAWRGGGSLRNDLRSRARVVLAAVGPMIAAGAEERRRELAQAWLDGYEHAEDFAEDGEKPFSVWDSPYIKLGENPDGSPKGAGKGSMRPQDATEADPAPPGPNDT